MHCSACDSKLETEYLYPGDTDVLDVYEEGGDFRVTFALACPECGAALSLDSVVDDVEEGEFELPLSDELYD